MSTYSNQEIRRVYDSYHRERLRKKVQPPIYLKFWNWIKSLYPKFWWKFIAPDNIKLKLENGQYWIYGIDRFGKEVVRTKGALLRTKKGREYIKKFAERCK